MTESPRSNEEELEAVPVVASGAELARVRAVGAGLWPVSVPPRQAAALAATGFVAGAATAAMVGRRAPRWGGRRRRRSKGVLGEVVSSNSFLVDIHLIRRP